MHKTWFRLGDRHSSKADFKMELNHSVPLCVCLCVHVVRVCARLSFGDLFLGSLCEGSLNFLGSANECNRSQG